MIRVLVVDDEKLMRDGLLALLARAKDVQVIGEARDGQEAMELVERLNPDIVTMDIRMPRLDGLEATRRIHTARQDARILIVAMSYDPELVEQAIENGALGYLAKTETFTELVPAVRTVVAGKPYFSLSISKMITGANA